MKKRYVILMSLLLVASLVGCSKDKENENTEQTNTQSTQVIEQISTESPDIYEDDNKVSEGLLASNVYLISHKVVPAIEGFIKGETEGEATVCTFLIEFPNMETYGNEYINTNLLNAKDASVITEQTFENTTWLSDDKRYLLQVVRAKGNIPMEDIICGLDSQNPSENITIAPTAATEETFEILRKVFPDNVRSIQGKHYFVEVINADESKEKSSITVTLVSLEDGLVANMNDDLFMISFENDKVSPYTDKVIDTVTRDYPYIYKYEFGGIVQTEDVNMEKEIGNIDITFNGDPLDFFITDK